MQKQPKNCEFKGEICSEQPVEDTNMCMCHLLHAMTIHCNGEPITKKKPKKATVVKQKPQVKRNKSAYIYFCIEKRPEVVANNLGATQKTIITELGRLWSIIKCDPNKIQKYKDLAKDDRIRYDTEKLALEHHVKRTPCVKRPAEQTVDELKLKLEIDELMDEL